MKREDFVFTIGFYGGSAIVDGAARRQHGKKSVAELLDLGLYRAAFCAALYDDKLDAFLDAFREKSTVDVDNTDQLKRLFGVYEVSDEIEKVLVIK